MARADVTLQLQTIIGAGDDRAALRFNGAGTLHGEEVKLEGTSLGLAKLQDVDDPYRLTLNARAGRTTVNFVGTIVPSNTENVSGTLRSQGPDLSKRYPVVPAALPWTPPYNLTGELTHTRYVWDFRRIAGNAGESDLKGDVRIDVSKPRTMVTADLTSARFDSKDLGGFIGLPPGEPAQRAQTAEQQKEELGAGFRIGCCPTSRWSLRNCASTTPMSSFAVQASHGAQYPWTTSPLTWGSKMACCASIRWISVSRRVT